MYIFMLIRSQVSFVVLDRMVTHSIITYLPFALNFLLDLVCTDKCSLRFGGKAAVVAEAWIENVQI